MAAPRFFPEFDDIILTLGELYNLTIPEPFDIDGD